MPYLFGSLVILNAVTLGYYLFFAQPSTTQTLQTAQQSINQPLTFTNSAEYIPPAVGNKN